MGRCRPLWQARALATPCLQFDGIVVRQVADAAFFKLSKRQISLGSCELTPLANTKKNIFKVNIG